MPLNEKGEKILKNLTSEYGAERGKQILYAGKNSGRFTGIDAAADAESEPGEKERAGEEKEREELDLPGQLKAEEGELEKLEREQTQSKESLERTNAIADRKKSIRALRDQIKTQAKEALKGIGAKSDDALWRMEQRQSIDGLVEQCGELTAGMKARLDLLG
jgi:hypothetical protein